MKERMTMETSKNVLVCEDDPVQLKILTTLIDQAGYHSVSARSPGEAVSAARRCGIDAVLTDVQLVDGNAFDLVGDLRRCGFDTPVLMASAYATQGMKDRARKVGVSHFFEKPFDLLKIKAGVDEVLKTTKKLDATMLIVDGHPQVRADLERAAVQAGFDALTAEDGVKAVEILIRGDRKVDMMLVDLHAPGSSGVALIRKALEIAPALHVVMLSGDARREVIRAGYDAGAASLVRKPISAERLQHFLIQSFKATRAEQKRAPLAKRHKGRLAVITLAAAALLIGAGTAFALQTGYQAMERYEARAERAMQGMLPRLESSKGQDAFGRWQAQQQLQLLRDSNDATRRYYDGHLQELRWQNRTRNVSDMPQFVTGGGARQGH
jgi:DNA-binding NtrC family response regulator